MKYYLGNCNLILDCNLEMKAYIKVNIIYLISLLLFLL